MSHYIGVANIKTSGKKAEDEFCNQLLVKRGGISDV